MAIAITSVLYSPIIILLVVLTLLAIPNYKISSKWAWLFDIVAPLIAGFISWYFTAVLNSANRYWMEGYSSVIQRMIKVNPAAFFVGILIGIPAYYIFRMTRMPRQVALLLSPLPFVVASLADFVVYICRGDELIASDFLSAKTALGVVSYYSIPLMHPVVLLGIPYLLFVIVCLRIKVDDDSKLAVWNQELIYLGALFASFLIAFGAVKGYSKNHEVVCTGDVGSADNGFLLNFAMSVDLLFPKTPSGYPGNQYFDDYYDNCASVVASSDVNVIVIMSESYTDPDMFFDNMNMDPDPFYDSVNENCIKGYALSSGYGGRTSNSEFELLTGITMAYMPDGSIPYSMYIKENFPSLIHFVSSVGYETYGMHPYRDTSYNRNNVYPDLGFMHCLFKDDFVVGDNDKLRDFISDKAAYRNVLSNVEDCDIPAFALLVSMQNHGGYTDKYDNFVVDTYVDDSPFSVNNYISLVKKSDEALEYLFESLQNEDEKYVVLIFGDHQPRLPNMGSDQQPGGDAWYVPYMIWANYELPDTVINTSDNPAGVTCIPYLGIDLLTAAGIELPPYYQFINEIRETIPVINSAGYYSVSAGKFMELDEFVSEAEKAAIMRYRYLQYNVVFDGGANKLVGDMLN